MIEIQNIKILSLFWKHNTFLAVYCTLDSYLSIYLKTKKQKKRAKQISKQDKTKKKEKTEEGEKKVLS